ncbi:F-box domain protein [Stipitochalara longipes BDJ]|nr:F-box domain protein [Stipitochalara longipes BDJ]
MSSSLEDCPNEVIENIVVRLVLGDICNLRLVSRTLATKATQAHFKSFFLSKHVDVTESALRAFVEFTKSSSLGCLIQHLVLIGVVNNTRQTDYVQLRESGTDVSLLSEAFRNIVANGKNGKLLSLSFEVVVYREDAERRLQPLAGGGWKFIWKSAADAFHTAFRSLAASSLPIEKLNIFNDRQLQRCSLAWNELGSIDTTNEGLITSLASLKLLSISFSNRIISRSNLDAVRSYDPAEYTDEDISEEESRDIFDIDAEAEDERNFIGLAKLLRLGKQLEDLELHQYRLSGGWRDVNELHLDRLFQRTAEMEMPPKLNRLELRGVYAREQDLLAFLRGTKVRNFSMYNVFMTSGTFRSIFDFCASDAADMEELYFNKLIEGELHQSVYFDGPGSSQYAPVGPGPSSDSLHRKGDEVKQRIIYRSTIGGGPLMASPTTLLLTRERWREYGPPLQGHA